ncbi:hypothetical protein Cadr_000012194, partial [Camelus dromedarius]
RTTGRRRHDPRLTALLCLGEIEEGGAVLVWEPRLLCQETPGLRTLRERSSAQVQGESLTGTSLPGLSVGVRTQVQAGTRPKPTIWLSQAL